VAAPAGSSPVLVTVINRCVTTTRHEYERLVDAWRARPAGIR
jgi:hypothetical protein